MRLTVSQVLAWKWFCWSKAWASIDLLLFEAHTIANLRRVMRLQEDGRTDSACDISVDAA